MDRFKIRDLFADERCSRAILDFVATTGMGRRAPEPVEEEEEAPYHNGSYVREERDEETRRRDVEMGAEVEEA